MKIILEIVFLVFALVQVNNGNNCNGFNGNDLLQSGKTTFFKQANTENSINSYETPINFVVPSTGIEIGVTSSTIADFTLQPTSDFSYYIQASRNGTSNSIIYRLIISNTQSWTSFQISYLVSGRQELSIGNFDAPANKWLIGTSNIFSIMNKIEKQLPQERYKVAAFISGITSQTTQFNIVINNKYYDNLRKSLSISFYCTGNRPIMVLAFVYIIYPQNHPIFDITYNFIPMGDIGSYQITGPIILQPNSKDIKYNQWMIFNRYLVCSGNQCPDRCILRQDCFNNNGNIWQDQCIYCAPGVIFAFGQCSKKCGANQMYMNFVCVCANGFTRQGKDCVNLGNKTCGTNQIYNDSLKSCTCSVGSYDLTGNLHCQQCAFGAISGSDGRSCTCNDSSKYWNNTANTCQNHCPSNQQWHNNQCTCTSGSSWYNQTCRVCPPHAVSAPDFSTCICNSSISYYLPSNNSCFQCDTLNHQVLNHEKSACVCQLGYILNTTNNKCQDNVPLKCDTNQILNTSTHRCDCMMGLIREGNTCRLPCGQNQVWNGQFCVCQPMAARYGICRVCPFGSHPNTDNSHCICTDSHQIFTLSTFTCITCPPNSSPNSGKTSCQCLPGYSIDHTGICISLCPPFEIPSMDNLTCICQNGWFRDSLGKCQNHCKIYQQWNGTTCICNRKSVKSNGGCVQCPAASEPSSSDQSKCVCMVGYTLMKDICLPSCAVPLIFNPALGKCQCKSGYTQNGTTCISICPSDLQWNGSSCICSNGQALYGRTCKTCPIETLSNSGRTACICIDSKSIFYVDTFSCLKCPNNSFPDETLTSCVCHVGFVADKNDGCVLHCGVHQVANYLLGACQCQWGYYITGNSTNCLPKCGINQQFNGKSCNCQPGAGKLNNICTPCPINSFSNSNRNSCKCLIPHTIFNPKSFQCQVCHPFSTNSADGTKCTCLQGYQSINGQCQPICKNPNQQINKITHTCTCKYGLIKSGSTCIQRCQINFEWTGTQCRCQQGWVLQNLVCKACPNKTSTNPSRTTCLWENNQMIFDLRSFNFVLLPEFAIANKDLTNFSCFAGYNRMNNSCVSSCPISANPDHLGNCACTGGLYLDSATNSCKQPSSCPIDSVWNSSTLQCLCIAPNQYILNGKCLNCGSNSFYSLAQKQCVCNTGFFHIGGICTSCDIKTVYNGTDCICKLGYYGTRTLCTRCHITCSVCSGPGSSQCLACSDISLVLSKGYCIKNTPCDPGFFIDDGHTKTCQKCNDNCIACNDSFQCNQCAIGYQRESLQISRQNVSACIEICGDGIKYQAECDDGNNQSGDGCSSTCFIQPGWTCFNGSSVQKSICNHFIPDSTVLIPMGIVNLGDRVIQSIRASYLPDCITQNQCSDCFKALSVNVIQSNVPILCTVSFVPFSQWQFLVQYNFQGLFVTSKFSTVIKLNQFYKGCFTQSDFDQQIQISIDPAFLAKVESQDKLTVENDGEKSSITKTFSYSPKISIPSAAKNVLKINN